MKILACILLIITSQLCHAEYKCNFLTKNLTFTTPKSDDIANTFWQDDKDGHETIKRLYITYKDGSLAVLEHRYCSVYNFEAAYYFGDKSKLANTKEFQKRAKLFFSYASVSDSSQQEAIATMIKELNEKEFDKEKNADAGYNGFDPQHGDTEYNIDYFPLDEVSVHEAALFVYMGLGVMH